MIYADRPKGIIGRKYTDSLLNTLGRCIYEGALGARGYR